MSGAAETARNLTEASMLLCGSRAYYPRVALQLVINGWIHLALAESILSPPAGANVNQHCPIVQLHPAFPSDVLSKIRGP